MIIVLMGVSGCWKSTTGEILAKKLGWSFDDADKFHSPENREKMARNIPLDDTDRWPWLTSINREMRRKEAAFENGIFACSALKKTYRDILRKDIKELRLIHLSGSFDFIHGILSARKGHFFKVELLKSQFDALQEPGPKEATVFEIDNSTPEDIASAIFSQLKLQAV